MFLQKQILLIWLNVKVTLNVYKKKRFVLAWSKIFIEK